MLPFISEAYTLFGIQIVSLNLITAITTEFFFFIIIIIIINHRCTKIISILDLL